MRALVVHSLSEVLEHTEVLVDQLLRRALLSVGSEVAMRGLLDVLLFLLGQAFGAEQRLLSHLEFLELTHVVIGGAVLARHVVELEARSEAGPMVRSRTPRRAPLPLVELLQILVLTLSV